MNSPLPSIQRRYVSKADASVGLFITAGWQTRRGDVIIEDVWEVYSRPVSRFDAKADKRIGVMTAAEFFALVEA